jgi:hypothetical protein
MSRMWKYPSSVPDGQAGLIEKATGLATTTPTMAAQDRSGEPKKRGHRALLGGKVDDGTPSEDAVFASVPTSNGRAASKPESSPELSGRRLGASAIRNGRSDAIDVLAIGSSDDHSSSYFNPR